MARQPKDTNVETDELLNYSLDEILTLNTRLQQELQRRRGQELESHKEKTYELAKAFGITVAQMFDLEPKPARRARAPNGSRNKPPMTVAYRDPANPENVAAAKGPKPQWWKDYRGQGRNMNDFRVSE